MVVSSLFERMRKVGAQRPTKIPKRSPWAGSGLFARNQIAIEPTIENIAAMKQKLLRDWRVLVGSFVKMLFTDRGGSWLFLESLESRGVITLREPFRFVLRLYES
jgi:hypothetical protein